MSIAPDPKVDNIEDEQDDFAQHFEEFASGKEPDPQEPKDEEADPPGGNDPQDDAPAPDDPKEGEAATEGEDQGEIVTPGDAPAEGGNQPPEGTATDTDDPWANVPDDIKIAFLDLEREKDEALHRANSDANRVAALTRKLQSITTVQPRSTDNEEQAKARKEALRTKVEQLRKDYGDIAEPLIELIEVQGEELQSVTSRLEGMTVSQQAQEIAREQAALTEAHPDWRQVVASKDWQPWLEVQPATIQALAQSWDARESSVALALFKAEKGMATQSSQRPQPQAQPTAQPNAATGERRKQQLEGGAAVKSKSVVASTEVPDDFDAAFKFYEQKRLAKARR